MPNFLIVDDHPLLRAGLSAVLSRAEEFYPVRVWEAGTRQQAHGVLTSIGVSIDLAFYDLNLPDSEGIEGFRTMKAALPQLPFAIVSGMADMETIAATYAAGASGFFRKDTSAEILIHGTALILNGGIFIDPIYFQQKMAPAEGRLDETQRCGSRRAASSQREEAVLDLLRQGLGNKEIAAKLGVAEGTVKAYVSALLTRYKVRSRAQLIVVTAMQGPPAGGVAREP
ncbi:two component LuxR family transcriptional regulator [Caballeronia calidae]|uniref:Two component LuxR family transcriptional regulator n=1 Tax=Caballeronia calidae TaxID=1777139 RepID=A0A158EHL3_9BURK|nr:response regulator transcription factor [Caballeronia calidae]SAL06283.1 two component LuxR family transcriptional regulator [Caballeronia calidae]